MLSADERLTKIHFKIKWADKHLGDLYGAINEFLKTNPYKVRAECDPQSRQPIYYIESVQNFPLNGAALIGDVIQNLRSALDHLAWQLVEIGCAQSGLILTDRERKQIGFPISNDSSAIDYEPTLQRKIKGAGNNAINKIRALNAYKGGNEALWRLNELNNIDKHRFLLTAGLSLNKISAKSALPKGIFRIFTGADGQLTSDHVSGSNLWLIPEKPIFPLEKDAKLFVDVPDAEIDLNDNEKFRFDVAFSESGIVEGESVYPTLVNLRNYVNGIVLSFRNDLV